MSKYTVGLSLVVVAALVFCATPALAAVGGYAEQFAYADGQLTDSGAGANVSGGLWTGHSGTTFNDNVQVSAGGINLNFPGSEDVHRLSGGVLGAGDKIYAAFDFSVPTGGAAFGDFPSNQYFAHFWPANFQFVARVFVLAPTVGGDFTIGLSSSGGNHNVTWADDFTFGQTIKAVLSYDFDTGDSELWLDPINQASANIVDTGVTEPGAIGAPIEGFAFRQDFWGSGVNPYQVRVENNFVSNNFNDVFTGVPEPTTLVLLGMGGMILLRRRR